MGRQTIIGLAAAVVLGLLAVFLANTYLVGAEKKAELSGTTRVAVAAVPLAYGVDITPANIRFVDYPAAAIPPGSFHQINDLLPEGKKRVALMPIQANEPILDSKISGAGQNASIAALLPDGMRATAVRVSDVSAVGGFVRPNDSVDVLITRSAEGSGQQITDVLLQNVRVIAIDQDNKGEDGKPVVGRTATLEVDQIDAQKLALASQIGSLSLVLRKPGTGQDNPVVETVSLNDLRYSLYGGARYPAPARVGAYQNPAPAPVRRVVSSINRRPAPRPSAPRAPSDSVEIVRGTQGSSYQVGSK
ncbi:Flp pilus assembly protein CpaB [Sphingomonas sp. ASV193]|uniref:Flp pilus assembly protein CpaB n=1 Tax=Sphingomonas sp. ASV193 TaxID=3144405 RepID=UPI0032E92DC4